MSIKLKVLGLGILAALATSAFVVVNASASSTGHFTSHLPAGHNQHLIIKGAEGAGTAHQLKFYAIDSKHTTTEPNNPIECTSASYHGTLEGLAATTSTLVRVRPAYNKCRTASEGVGSHQVTVDVPTNCGTNVLEFTSGGTGTVHVLCAITITHNNCEITVHPQTASGVTYSSFEEGGKFGLTLTVAAKTIEGTYHNGICVFLGTSPHYFEMVGSATVWGEDTDQNRVSITHKK